MMMLPLLSVYFLITLNICLPFWLLLNFMLWVDDFKEIPVLISRFFPLNCRRSFGVCCSVCLVRAVTFPCGLLCILLLLRLCIFIIQADYWLMLVYKKQLCDPKEMHALNPSNSVCAGCWTDVRWKWLLLSVHLG